MRIDKNHWLLNKPIAHRGLWGGEIIENSLVAYEKATEHRTPIEIDLYVTTDGEIVSFHDASLKRMTGADGYIYEKSLTELKNLKLMGTNQKIPTLSEILEIAEGKSPLLIEIKNQPDQTAVKKIVDKLKSYKGEFAVQSFNPIYLNRVKKLAPEFIRGILGTASYAKEESAVNRYILKNLSLNFIIKPDFISYSYVDLPLKKRIKRDIPVVAWTLTSKEAQNKVKGFCDNIIFENYTPENL